MNTANFSFTPASLPNFKQKDQGSAAPTNSSGIKQKDQGSAAPTNSSGIKGKEVEKANTLASQVLSSLSPFKSPDSPTSPRTPPQIPQNFNLSSPTTPPSKKPLIILHAKREREREENESPVLSTPPKRSLIIPPDFTEVLAASAGKVSSAPITQINNTDPYFQAFPELEGAKFLGNGAESAVFRRGLDVFKIPIFIPPRKMAQPAMQNSERANRNQANFKRRYEELIPVFAKLTSVHLTHTEFFKNDKNMCFTKQPYYSTDLQKGSLTSSMIAELRGLITAGTRADLRPSNFKVDGEGHLQLVDCNMPDDDDELDMGEMKRVWNAIDPELGALLTEKNNEIFQKLLVSFLG